MSDDLTKIVLGDTAISAIEQGSPGRKRLFGKRKADRPPLTQCENCGAQLHGHWCGQCGQPAIDYRRSFRHVLADVLNEFLNWDSKFFATIGLLIARPWKLTNQFLAGHRVRYVHPLRLYLLASILFFFAVNYWARSVHFNRPNLSPKDRAEIEAKLATTNLTPEQRAKVEKALRLGNTPTAAAAITDALHDDDEEESRPAPAPTATAASPVAPDASAKPSLNEPMFQFDKEKPDRADKAASWLERRARDKLGEHGTNAELFVRGLISNLPYMVLCCIPLFALVLKILYVRRRIFYIDHLVYALHIHSFAFLAIMLIVAASIGLNRIVPGLLAGWLIALLWIVFAIQIFLSIRRVYRQGWFRTIVKFFVGGLVYLVVLFSALVVTLIITVALP